MRSGLLAAAVERSKGSGLIPTRHRFSRSASQQTATVGSLLIPPKVCSLQAYTDQLKGVAKSKKGHVKDLFKFP